MMHTSNILVSVANIAVLLWCGQEVSSFTFAHHRHQNGLSWRVGVSPVAETTKLYMSDDFPSDSSVEALYDDATTAVFDVESRGYEGSTNENLINSVLNELPLALASGGDLSKEARGKINEALLSLEALNPTERPTESPLLNGVWTLRYAAGYTDEWALASPTRQLALFLYSGGYSPGLFALSLAQKLPSQLVDVGNLSIAISRSNPRVEAKVGLKILGSGAESNVRVMADLVAESPIRLSETYVEATVLGRKIELPKQLQYSRRLYVTYLDEDLLIVRDDSGIPEVLLREEKTFQSFSGSQPDEMEDLKSPGEQ